MTQSVALHAANISCAVSATVLGRLSESRTLDCAEEEAVAFRYNGFPHAVMMATPIDLEDFTFGFSLTEGVIDTFADVEAISTGGGPDGATIEVSLRGASLQRFLAGRRIRQLRGNTSCGLCGLEDLGRLHRAGAKVQPAGPLDEAAILAAFERLRERQPLSRLTRCAHAAAWVSSDGRILTVREDVGRHNALDKLICAGLRGGFDRANGFCLVTSRCSFEMAQKAIAAGFSAIVSASAPTALAIRTASAAGLTLCALSQERAPLMFAPQNSSEESSWQLSAS